MHDPPATVTIPARFNGPPDSGNGGYSCGTAAELLGAPIAAVTLRSPPPLDRPLALERTGDGVELRDGDTVVAEARELSSLDLELPEPPSVAEAEAASARYPWFTGHTFPTCFVCGPQRAEGDGLRIFAGEIEGDGVGACVWTPAPEWAGSDGAVRERIVWAALDCPSAVGALPLGGPATFVLGRLSASLEAPVRAGEPQVVVTWPIARDGRKRHSGSAILTAAGEPCARAAATWVDLEPAPGGRGSG